MPVFYEDGNLHLGQNGRSIELKSLTHDREKPFYIYDLDGMIEEVQRLQSALNHRAHIHYAVKANGHPMILQGFAKLGIGADVVSGGEVLLASEAGIPAEKIIFSGVGKTVKEIEIALEMGVNQINVESVSELRRIAAIAKRLSCRAPVAFRFNPDVNPETHPYITTGFRENKFGLSLEQLEEFIDVVKEHPKEIYLQGLTLHIGSQLLEIESLREAITKARTIFLELKQRGFSMETFDIGGGIGVDYQKGLVSRELVQSYGSMVNELIGDLDAKIYCEPGRVISAVHGALLGEIQYLKFNGFRHFAILNTGMHHLSRPSLYQAYHRILPLTESSGEKVEYDVVGPICESSDVLGRARAMSALKEGDWLAIAEAGAYGMAMANNYNAHALPSELIVYQGQVIPTEK